MGLYQAFQYGWAVHDNLLFVLSTHDNDGDGDDMMVVMVGMVIVWSNKTYNLLFSYAQIGIVRINNIKIIYLLQLAS